MTIDWEAFHRWKGTLNPREVLVRLGAGGRQGRYFCPLCQSAGVSRHSSPDLAVYDENLHCFKCGFHGDAVELVRRTLNLNFLDAVGWLGFSPEATPRLRKNVGSSGNKYEDPVFTASAQKGGGGGGRYISPEVINAREALSAYFEGELRERTLGAKYLNRRGIPLSHAKSLRVGYAPWPTWPLPSFAREEGHVVFPHTDAEGRVVNLYARAVELETSSPKALRHCHLPGPKAFFMGNNVNFEDVTLAEGAFDALSLLLLGKRNLVGVFGVHFDLNMLLRCRSVTFAFDRDKAGERWKTLSLQLLQAGVIVSSIADELPVGAKDFNETLVARERSRRD